MKHRNAALLAAGVAGVLVAAGVAVATGNALAASTGCSVTYSIVGQWPGGFQGDIKITNLGDPLTGWTLAYDFPDANQKISQGWGATFTQSGSHVTAVNMSYNGGLGTNASVDTGFISTWASVNPM